MSPVHQVWPKPSCKAQWKGEEDEADRERGGKTTSGNGQAWSSPSRRGQWRSGKNGGNWLRSHLWCPIDPRGWGIDEMRCIYFFQTAILTRKFFFVKMFITYALNVLDTRNCVHAGLCFKEWNWDFKDAQWQNWRVIIMIYYVCKQRGGTHTQVQILSWEVQLVSVCQRQNWPSVIVLSFGTWSHRLALGNAWNCARTLFCCSE